MDRCFRTWLIIAMLLILWFISNESTIIFSAYWFQTPYFRCIINLFSHYLCHWYVVSLFDGTSININRIFDTYKTYLGLNITSYIQAMYISFHTHKHINFIQYYTRKLLSLSMIAWVSMVFAMGKVKNKCWHH